MGYNIYYMYNIKTGVGYIGQNTGKSDKRIIDHYNASLKPKKNKKGKDAYDGGAQLITNSDSLADIRYKFFTDYGYGIPIEVYNRFLMEWSLDGGKNKTRLWADLTEKEKLDLAEIMHNMWAHLNGRPWNKYNRLLGGLGYTKDNPDAMRSLTYRFRQDGLKELQQIYDDFGVDETLRKEDYTITRFSVQKTLSYDDFSKLVYPMQYLKGKAFIQNKISEVLEKWFSEYLKDVFSGSRKTGTASSKFRTALEKELGEALAQDLINPDRWVSVIQDAAKAGKRSISINKKDGVVIRTNRELVDILIDSLVSALTGQEIQKAKIKINKAIKKAIGRDANWTWQLDDVQIKGVLKRLFRKLESLSMVAIANIFSEKRNKIKVDFSDVIKIPHKLLVSIDEKYTTLPKWALLLKRAKLLSNWETPARNEKIKVEICKNVCDEMFVVINNILKESQSYDRYDTLQSRLHELLTKNDWTKSGYDWDFCRTVIEVWHEYTYGHDAWIKMSETSFDDKVHTNWFARKDIVQYAEKDKNFRINWYQGSFYKSSGISKGDLEKAAKVLASRWTW